MKRQEYVIIVKGESNYDEFVEKATSYDRARKKAERRFAREYIGDELVDLYVLLKSDYDKVLESSENIEDFIARVEKVKQESGE